MKFTKKWMVVPFIENYTPLKDETEDKLNEILKQTTLPTDTKIKEYNQILTKSFNNFQHPVVPKQNSNELFFKKTEPLYLNVQNHRSPKKKAFRIFKTKRNILQKTLKPKENIKPEEEDDDDDDDDEYDEPMSFTEENTSINVPPPPPHSPLLKSPLPPKQPSMPQQIKRKSRDVSFINNSITTEEKEPGEYQISTRHSHQIKKSEMNKKRLVTLNPDILKRWSEFQP